MAGEEITKFAVNSTLGTDKFKPLDKMIEEIYNNYHIVPSNLQIGELKKEYTIKYNGRLRLYGTAKNNGSASNQGIDVNITINGNITMLDIIIPPNQTSTGYVEVDVNKNDVIYVNMSRSYSDVVFNSGYIGGEVVAGDVAMMPAPLE